MSQLGNNCYSLTVLLKQFPDSSEAVIDSFIEVLENDGYDEESVVLVLKCSLGITDQIDELLLEAIDLQQTISRDYEGGN